MVRVKNRYLVANILYPATTSAVKDGTSAPSIMHFHAPTPDSLHTGQLIRLIRDGIENLFGDYGMGMTNRTLKGGFVLSSQQFWLMLCL